MLPGPLYLLGVYADGGISSGAFYPAPLQDSGGVGGLIYFSPAYAVRPADGGITVTQLTAPKQIVGQAYAGGALSLDVHLNFVDDQGYLGNLAGTISATGCDAYQLVGLSSLY